MEADDMIEKLEAGAKAIDLSIKKWVHICDNIGTDEGGSNCALCMEYYLKKYDVPEACKLCPLVLYKKEYQCDEPYSPYDSSTHNPRIMLNALREVKRWMIDTGKYDVMV